MADSDEKHKNSPQYRRKDEAHPDFSGDSYQEESQRVQRGWRNSRLWYLVGCIVLIGLIAWFICESDWDADHVDKNAGVSTEQLENNVLNPSADEYPDPIDQEIMPEDNATENQETVSASGNDSTLNSRDINTEQGAYP